MPEKVEVGQVWKDKDPRMVGRRLKVVSISVEHAILENVRTKRKTRIHLDRFRPNLYELEAIVKERENNEGDTICPGGNIISDTIAGC